MPPERDTLSRGSERDEDKRPAGAEVLITVHPGLPPAWAIGLFVSADDQRYIDAMRARSYALALARGHIRR